MTQIKKFTFGQPSPLTPAAFCPGFCYREGTVSRSREDFSFRALAAGCVLEYRMEPGTRVLGFGLQLKQFDHTGHKLTLRVNADPVSPNGESHAPVPFFVTNKGYGLYVDTPRYAEFYCGLRRPGGPAEEGGDLPALTTEELYAARRGGDEWMSIRIPAEKGVDVYWIEGDTVGEIVAAYNRMAGGGPRVPDWGLGVFYRCCTRYDEAGVRETAAYFRQADIPCDVLGLEPGWQSRTYSCSYTWDPGRFPRPAELIRDLKAMGYHVNLWEHAFVHPTAPIYEALRPFAGDYGVWGGLVPDFALPAAREIFAAHHRRLIDMGVDGFKLDECDGSDNTGGWSFPLHAAFPSGLDGEQYHSLLGVLYARTLAECLPPTLSQIRQMGALAAPYPFVLYSDLYDHRDFVRGVVTASLSGLLWAPEVRHAVSKKDMLRRLQTAVFSVQCLINAWYCDRVPWLQWDCEEEVRALLKLRQRLVPVLRAAFDRYAAEGVPPVRALVLDFPEDPEVWGIDDEYMFGEDLLVAPLIDTESDEREVYLPAGEWIDWFTGEKVSPGRFRVCTQGIPVYRKI